MSDLRRIKGWENYSKSDADTYRKTISKVDKAIQNARKLEKKHIEEGLKPQTVEFMPSSEVYTLVGFFLNSIRSAAKNLPEIPAGLLSLTNELLSIVFASGFYRFRQLYFRTTAC